MKIPLQLMVVLMTGPKGKPFPKSFFGHKPV
jgi:hypothetical protein